MKHKEFITSYLQRDEDGDYYIKASPPCPCEGTSVYAREVEGAVYLINLRFAGVKAKVPRIGEVAVRGGGKRT